MVPFHYTDAKQGKEGFLCPLFRHEAKKRADVTMLIGNGHVPGHAELVFQILRENKPLRKFFEELYA